VGKTTVIARAAELAGKYRKVRVVVFGTLMFEEAQKKHGIKSRDEIRKLSVEEQRRLQESAAQRISEMQEEIVIIDTHLFINTGEGYYPGLPMRLLNIMRATNLILVAAEPGEIEERRRTDPTRSRDAASVDEIRRELELSRAMVATSAVISGAPFAIVMNNNNGVEQAATQLIRILGGTA
jgi:adenylate kinase